MSKKKESGGPKSILLTLIFLILLVLAGIDLLHSRYGKDFAPLFQSFQGLEEYIPTSLKGK